MERGGQIEFIVISKYILAIMNIAFFARSLASHARDIYDWQTAIRS